ncbi:aminotransferase class I/II-fold pyridoxal phosphate-dependent enzyme [Arthrobacter sp. H35-D1]|uniref:aminotransferase class I/II-fold pyridoxal phosphate-dependent enzyme n=1 Tax=Arthrobacter sp. H35-D1 TaxID=3046202 RepID=UPI0024B9D0F7|nr:aminotransferase class I/II-fold pyridoxal phosphate-dependent enzyme [Arthrobacter sp. H35-D1]MDJ0311990.1 aminotransferase class I/II-fold pyridoxal phosphate-dependent enzyme [Arthrobacter sp. H35-D1]
MRKPLTVASRANVQPFAVMDILRRVAELRVEGRDVISLCAGEPGGGAPSGVSTRAAALHASGAALTYTPALGLAELRRAIAGHYKRWYGIEVPAQNVAVTTGSSGAFMLVFLAAFNPGDKVALARPGYPAYKNILTALGIEVIELDAGADTRFQPTPGMLADAVAEHGPLAGLVLASPANPTGTMISRDELAALTNWCVGEGVRLVSDEIYHGVTYPDAGSADPRGVCAWELDRSGVVISSFSKYWGMTGWRLGWAIVPEDLAQAVEALGGNVALCPPAPAQIAAVEAFSEESYAQADAAVAEFSRTRDYVLGKAADLGWVDAAPADGAFYFYANLGPALAGFADSVEYCAALLENAGVALVPGTDFDGIGGGAAVRLSFAAGYDAVREALARIEKFQASQAQ